MKNKILATILVGLISGPVFGQAVVHDDQKRKQWQSMEVGPWEFAPDWWYYFMHKDYSGAKMKWRWRGFKSGWVITFEEDRSNIRRIMPDRVTAEETQRQKLRKTTEERNYVEALYKEDLLNEADRTIDVTYAAYEDEFDRMQDAISEGLSYCLLKSNGKLQYQVDELARQNEVICSKIAYIHKQGMGYELENAQRQKAYEEAKADMRKIVNRTAKLSLAASKLY